ncbi:SpoIIE family protein phosphatase [Cryptosporangium sp. NPDC048952]|uniref:PP2C family protein-serine/threonine phosphatase n=1 Tax=Cryptosporangium sp. NPDC048952 TaxID=3363961 RepID=UPI0037178F94
MSTLPCVAAAYAQRKRSTPRRPNPSMTSSARSPTWSAETSPTHVGSMLRGPTAARLNLVTTEPLPHELAEPWTTVPANSDHPTARPVRERRPLFILDRDEFASALPAAGRRPRTDRLARPGMRSSAQRRRSARHAAVRLSKPAAARSQRTGPHPHLGRLRHPGPGTRASPARPHHRRRNPAAGDAHRAARRPALRAGRPLPAGAPPQAGRLRLVQRRGNARRGRLALVIVYVTGHDISAAARMGQLRSMLPAYLIGPAPDPTETPRTANYALGDHIPATALIATVGRDRDDAHRVRWSPAGHPPPIVLLPDGTARALNALGLMLGVRPDHPARLTSHIRLG